MSPTWSIRPASADNRPILSRICLLTGDAGQSGEGQYHFPELLGLVYAEPYVVVPPWFGFLLVCTESDGSDEVVGYVLGTPYTRAFESAIEKTWYTHLWPKYPKDPYPPNATPADQHMINVIHTPDTAPQAVIDVSQAHIHIDLLPQAQGKGWGTKLIAKAVEYLKEQGCDSLFVGIGKPGRMRVVSGDGTTDPNTLESDSRNARARAFYLAIGFKRVPAPHGEYYCLDFKDWKRS
jgi:GNAT superfamily N-acetyltransferase